MSGYGYAECLATAQASGTARNTFTATVTLLPSQALHTIPADDWQIGKGLLIKATGDVSNVVTAQPTFTFNVVFITGGTPTTVWTSGAILTSTTAHTTVPWDLEIMLTCRAVGASANLMGQGKVMSRAFLDAGATADITTLGHPTLLVPETTPAVGSNYNSNAPQQVDLQAACSVSNAANGIQLHQYWLFDIN